MPRTRSIPFASRRGQRTKVAWSSTASLTGMTVVPAGSAVLFSVLTPSLPEQTIVRSRGVFFFQSDQLASTEQQLGAVGVGVVTEQAAGIGVTAIPHPVTDADDGLWFVHRYFASGLALASAVGFDPREGQMLEIDSKAMRKVGGNERLVIVVENISSSFGLQAWLQMRFLSKLP